MMLYNALVAGKTRPVTIKEVLANQSQQPGSARPCQRHCDAQSAKAKILVFQVLAESSSKILVKPSFGGINRETR